jgi:NAD(P)H-dependent flavin oxidoreductase YrpB (nitropropane dioxygenase family)
MPSPVFPGGSCRLSAEFEGVVGKLPLLSDHRGHESSGGYLTDKSGIGRIVLKGCEASGFVSGETTLALYSAAKEMLRNSLMSRDILIWGSISTPEAAAALLSTGATGIVFESVHWLTDLVAVDDRQRQRLSNLRLDSTDLVGLDLQVPCRLFNKGNSIAFKEIKGSRARCAEQRSRRKAAVPSQAE